MLQSISYQLRLAIVCCVVLGFAPLLFASDSWTEVQSPHFRVLTDASGRDAREVADEFEQIRYVFVLRFHHDKLDAGAPLTIVAARDSDTLRRLEPALWKSRGGSQIAGEFHRGWEAQYALVRLDQWNTGFGHEVVFHEYTHSILHANAHWLPVWLDEGLAEFYAYTRFEDKRILIGVPSERFAILRSRTLIPVETMLSVTPASPYYHDSDKTDLFYAEAWAMVHFMVFGPGMDGGNKVSAFYSLLQNGVSQQEAFRQTFGDPKAFDVALSHYVSLFTFKAGVLPMPPSLDAKTFPEHKLSPAETDYALGRFEAGAGYGAEARRLIEQALALDPNLAGAHQSLGFLEFREGDDADARLQWAQAFKLDPTLELSLFAGTMSAGSLDEQSVAQLAGTRAAMEHVVALNPAFAPAWVELSLIAWKQGSMLTAYQDAQRAEALEPWRAGYHLLTGEILLHGGHPDLAAQYARYVAKRWTGPDHDEAVDLWNQVPAAQRGSEPPLNYDIANGFSVARGVVLSETCGKIGDANAFDVELQTADGSRPLRFTSKGALMIGFSDTLWWGEDHFSPCHHLAGHPALLVYAPGAGGNPGTLVDMEIRDALPGAPAAEGASQSKAVSAAFLPAEAATAATPAQNKPAALPLHRQP